MSEVLSEQRILDAAEEVLRRFGPGKANVVDVARALGVSHGSVYRQFQSKVALRDAVAERWLARITAPLAQIVDAPRPASERLEELVRQLSATKRRMATDDPEMFATFDQIVAQSRRVVSEHLDRLAAFLTEIIEDGAASGEFEPTDASSAGRAVLHATARFHHPAHAAEWNDPGIEEDLEAVMSLLLHGLMRRE